MTFIKFNDKAFPNKKFAGVGSRKTPRSVRRVMTRISNRFEELGWIGRSGGADGADEAFRIGYKDENKFEEYLPCDTNALALKTVAKYHPCGNKLRGSDTYRKHARNAQIILGEVLNDPVSVVVCWTPDGARNHQERTRGTGGTGQAISIAADNGILVINLARSEHMNAMLRWLQKSKIKKEKS